MKSDSVLVSITPTPEAKSAANKAGITPVDGDILLCFEAGDGRHEAISRAISVDLQSRFLECFFRARNIDTLLKSLSHYLSETCGFSIVATPVSVVGTTVVDADNADELPV